ncbi:hypothetical protein BYT27DRAFT_7194595 [Phlegmacium glaucopus]|nr:hypothetical protein BYT27DRAFT_7194595 [Phlegmacium glaucopus]
MTSTFVYTPQINYRNSPYLGPIYDQTFSPFIPNISLSGSPYARNASLPPSPNPGYVPLATPYATSQIPFPGSQDDTGYPPDPWGRGRRPSWHGDGPATDATTAWLNAPLQGYQRQQTRSFGASPFQQPVGLDGYWPPPLPYSPYVAPPLLPQITIHPWLNAEMPRSDFIFNLSLPHFAPMRYVGNNQTVLLTSEELAQPATHPPIYQLQMQCDIIPNWPIILQYNPNPYRSANTYPTAAPPITLGDVLSGIHNSLHLGITQYDWAALTPPQERAISRAYTKRCKAMGSTTMIRNEGVRRVDFLLDKVWFRGLARVGEGLENLKLIVS